MINQLEQEITAINHSITYSKQQLKQENNPHIKQKIQHYIDGLEKELQIRLEQVEK